MKNPMESGFPKQMKIVDLETQKVQEYMEKDFAQKDLAEKAQNSAETKESPIKLKEIKDVKTLAAIEFLQELPAWSKRLGELEMNSEISAENYNLIKNWMKDPKHTYEDGKWSSTGIEAAKDISRQRESWEAADKAEFESAKSDFNKKFGNKLNVWKSKGYEVEDMDRLVKAYMKDKDLDLVTTKDKKVMWGKTKAGYEVNL
jgi:hypothetical protein